MPKELTHWQVARAVFEGGLPAPLKTMLQDHLPLYYLGAVAHDIPFYDLTEPAEASLERVGNLLHGVNGENTLVPLLDILGTALEQEEPEPFLSFFLGMLTHFFADSTFHPAVYYFSGNYFDPDPTKRGKTIFRHRLLETGMDLWLETARPMTYPQTLIRLWHDAGEEGHLVFALLARHYEPPGDVTLKARFKSAWQRHRIFQAAFRWSVPWRILRLYRQMGHPGVEKLEALFYRQPFELSFYHGVPEWQHPVTGERFKKGMGELFEESVEKAVSFFRRLGVRPPQVWPEVLREIPALSLDSGLAYVGVMEMRYFSQVPLEDQIQRTP